MIFETLATTGHEEVVFCHNKDAGLKAIIAIHNTVLGPSLGGLRMWPYKSEQEAIDDVLRLSRGMTYKNAVAGLNLGGGKAVIIGDPARDKSEALFRAFGRFVNSLNGRYITAEDVGIDVNDMEWVFRETSFVTGVHQVHGGSGDPSPFTAFGAMQGLLASSSLSFAMAGCNAPMLTTSPKPASACVAFPIPPPLMPNVGSLFRFREPRRPGFPRAGAIERFGKARRSAPARMAPRMPGRTRRRRLRSLTRFDATRWSWRPPCSPGLSPRLEPARHGHGPNCARHRRGRPCFEDSS